VEAMTDLVRDNTGPLAELWNLDKGCWVVPLQRDIPDNDNAEIQGSLNARDSSKSTESSKGFERRSVSRKRRHLESIVFKGFILSYFFS
jgi:hypothetical protein